MQLFPESGFDQSAITPVFLGVLVSWFFTETLGWVFVGLVVPGYLATLFLLDPRSASIDVAEAALTYGVARVLCEQLSLSGLTSRVFGRERFLVILVVSVLVRLGVEGALIPLALPHAKWAYSIGLVVVPLSANACWKTGLARGLVQNGVPTLIVYGLLKWLLVPHTNLSLAGFHLAIENVASSFLRSPHAYITLLTGAVIAAFANVRYGWDYGGILIPALIALVVSIPLKFAATFAEAGVLLVVVAALVRFTRVGRWNIEGPRRPVLFLSVDYLLRYGLAAAAGRHLAGSEIVELTGLGYLLPSLLAVKASQKGSAALVFLPTATVSVAAFGASTAFAALLPSADTEVSGPEVTRELEAAPGTPFLAALWASALARPSGEKAGNGAPERGNALSRAVVALARGEHPERGEIAVQPLSDGFRLVRERFQTLDQRRGGSAVLFSDQIATAKFQRVALIPAPLAAPQAAALAGHWLSEHTVDAVVVAGVEESKQSESAPSEAESVARALAGTSKHGIVVALRAGQTGCMVRERSAGRGLVREFLQQHSELSACSDGGAMLRAGEDLSLALSRSFADEWVGAGPSLPSTGTSSALALALGELHAVNPRPSLEDLLALRRLVLEPLFSPESGGISPSLSTAAAAALGYRLVGPASLPNGMGRLLLPDSARGSIAVVAEPGARELVLEVPHASNATLRTWALRLSTPLHAQAVILGLGSGEGALTNAAFAEAHAVATWPHAGKPSAVVVVREGGTASFVGVAPWGGSAASELAEEIAQAVRDFGLTSQLEAIDLASREQAARSTFGDAAVVTLTLSPELLRTPELASDTRLLRELTAFPVHDDDCGSEIQALAQALPARSEDAPSALLELAGRAVNERSVTALRELEATVASTATRAAVARADAGVYLVVVGRRERHLRVGVYPILFAAPPAPGDLVIAATLRQCSARVRVGGTCLVEVLP